jgi:hypothetical protein
LNPRPTPSRQASRYALLDGLRPISRKSTRKCRKVRISPTVQIQKAPDGGVLLAGVHTCGGVRDCPVCAAKIYATRGAEVSSSLRLWRVGHKGRKPGYCYMLTVTLKHKGKNGRKLCAMRKGLADAWRYFNQGRSASQLKQSMGLVFYVRGLEVTHGKKHGWHPHLHNVLFTSRKLDELHEREIQERWQDCVRRALGSEYVPTLAHGAKLSSEFSDEYLTKLGLEIAAIDSKEGRKGNRSPWAIAGDAVAGDEESKLLWQEYCREMRGARQLTWSRGARRFFGLGNESDDELASDGVPVVEGVGFVLGEFAGKTWDRLSWRRGFVSSVIAAATSETPVSSLAMLNCLPSTPKGRVFGDEMREPSSSRETCQNSSPPLKNVTPENGARREPPDHVPLSDSCSVKR